MAKAGAALLAVILVAAAGIAVAFALGVGGDVPGTGDGEANERTPARSDPLLVGFMDDVSFRWDPDRAQKLDRARATGAELVRALVRWNVVAPERPGPDALAFHEPLLYELDELVANTDARGMSVMLTIVGTPDWANGGLGQNHAPTDLEDLRVFAQALAERYPTVRHYSVWNEPNIELFLAPQFDEEGRSVAPQTYAAMYRAAQEGIEAANPDALVAIGETSSHGKDEPSKGFMQDRHSPARFAELLAQADPELEFHAWAHHPYPVQTGTRPDGLARWPNVTLPTLDRFGQSLDTWFGREDVPIWITELGYEVAPAEPKGVPADTHAEYAAQSLALAATVPRVEMFVWFAFADSEANTWESGLLDETGAERPAFAAFTAAVREHAR
jgi:Cellulase (glycosyl hydrolase family 5)